MAVYTNPLTLTSQFEFCGLPLRVDSYGGCAFQCSYCFARHLGGHNRSPLVRPAERSALGRQLRIAATRPSSGEGGVLGQLLRKRVPLHFGGMSDPFQPAERRYRVTEAYLKDLAQYEYPTVISTRGPLVSRVPYREIIRSMRRVVVQFSFSTSRDRESSLVEPAAPSPSTLLRAMETLAKDGVLVTCRWQPYIPGFSEGPTEFVRRIAATGCRHVAFEHLKLPLELSASIRRVLCRAVGYDVYGSYRSRGAFRDGREYILPSKEKLPMVLAAKEIAHRHRLTFGAADTDLLYLSDFDCCCSGVDQFPGFQSWFKHQIGWAVKRCIGRPILYESISNEWTPDGSIDRYLNSHSRIGRRDGQQGSVKAHMRLRWNGLSHSGGPRFFYGVTDTKQVSSDGYKIYGWNPDILREIGQLSSGSPRMAADTPSRKDIRASKPEDSANA